MAVVKELRRADEILEVASRLFYERGYQGVSTRALAQAAGIQGGSLYHHFASKEEILYRVTQYASREFFAGLLPHLSGDGSFPERLDRFVRSYVLDSWERRYAIAVLFRDMGHLSPGHFEELRSVRRRFQQTFQRFLADGVAAGELSVPDPKLAGIAVLDMLKGVDHWMRGSGRLGIQEVAGTYAVLILQMTGAAI
jgi:AcrR family transcriptional regulator